MKTFQLTFIFLIFSHFLFAKADSLVKPQVRFSPTMISNLLTEKGKYVKVTYGQPFKKGREIFGNLVPLNEIWRLGANEATEITINRDFEINGHKMKAGTYSLFAIPHQNDWEIIFNNKLGQWGTFTYKESENVYSVSIPIVENSDVYEGLTFEMKETLSDKVEVLIYWDSVKVIIPLTLMDNTLVSDTKTKKAKRGRCIFSRRK